MLFKEKYGVDDVTPFEIRAPRDILRLLTSLYDGQQPMKLMRRDSSEIVQTQILDIDVPGGQVFLKPSLVDDSVNDLRYTPGIWVESLADQVYILFPADWVDAHEDASSNGDSWAIALPETMIRLQRREYFRVPTKISNPVRCTVPGIASDQATALGPTVVTLKDISLGGASLLDHDHRLDATVGRIYPDCQLALPGGPTIVADLSVANIRDVAASGQSVRTLGCKYVGLAKPMAMAVQRYITQLELEYHAKGIRSF